MENGGAGRQKKCKNKDVLNRVQRREKRKRITV
jgi:hypothetical protein